MVSRLHQSIDSRGLVFRSEIGIPHDHLQSPVPEQFCDGAQIDSGHNQSTCKSMAVANKKGLASPSIQIRNGRKIDPDPLFITGSHIQIEVRYVARGFGASQRSTAFMTDNRYSKAPIPCRTSEQVFPSTYSERWRKRSSAAWFQKQISPVSRTVKTASAVFSRKVNNSASCIFPH